MSADQARATVALGQASLSPRHARFRLVAFLIVAAVGLLLVLSRIVLPPAGTPPLPAGGWAIEDTLMVGGQPSDRDLADLRDAFRVSAVVNVRPGEMPVEHRTAESFGLEYRWLPLEPRARPRVSAIRRLVSLVEAARRRGNAVLVHDATGTERAPLVVAAVLVGLGYAPDEAVRRATHGDADADASPRRTDRAWLRMLERVLT